jgi:hypothetical protein
VDGQIVSVGQRIDGFRLASISGRSATFQSDTDEATSVTLNLAERAGPPVAGVTP